jgi:hypothetical protein
MPALQIVEVDLNLSAPITMLAPDGRARTIEHRDA